MNYDSYKYGRYIDTNQETRWATQDEIKNSGAYVDLSADDYPAGGLPLLSDGKEAYVDDRDTHTLIFGATGSKKTRLFCMPMINIFAKAGESFVVTDPKGELYARTSGLVKSKGYKTVVLNFRDIGRGDAWNPLALPYRAYHSENREAGISMLNDFVTVIAEPHKNSAKDQFWPEMAASLMLANLLLMAECGTEEEMNVTSLASLCNISSAEMLKFLADKMDPDTIAALNYEGALSAINAKQTMGSIYASMYAMLRVFNTQKNLTKMLSCNSVDLSRIGLEKTAVYIIVPDEKTTCHFLVTTFIKQVYEVLIAEAQKQKGYTLPVRVNFVLDEFCNIPTIPEMPSMISAARSRNMRYYLVVQSLHQLRGRYGEDADTIKGNCDNWVFLTSKELDLLREISELCGTVYTANNRPRALISVSELQRLSKERGEALIMHSRQYPIISEIADIDDYEMFKGYEPVPLASADLREVKMFNLRTLYLNVYYKKVKPPFSSAPFESATPMNKTDNVF